MYPHFVCPNCRSVADLEAELDDPFAYGEWEDAPSEALEHAPPVAEDTSAPPNITVQEQNQEIATSSTTNAPEQGGRRDSKDAEHTSDIESHLSGDDRRTPSSGSESSPPETSSSTIPAVDIAPRKSSSEAQTGVSHLAGPSYVEDSSARTPSPNGTSALAEGPMTPRNDFGPFVFDGSAGRVRPITDVSTANVSADESEDTSKQS